MNSHEYGRDFEEDAEQIYRRVEALEAAQAISSDERACIQILAGLAVAFKRSKPAAFAGALKQLLKMCLNIADVPNKVLH